MSTSKRKRLDKRRRKEKHKMAYQMAVFTKEGAARLQGLSPEETIAARPQNRDYRFKIGPKISESS